MDTALLIIVLVVGLVVGSVFWILPSPAERRRMKLRQAAYERGFRVKQQSSDKIHQALGDLGEAGLYYFRLGKFPAVSGRHVWVREGNNWKAVTSTQQTLSEAVQAAGWPDCIAVVLLSSSEVGFAWDERGVPGDVEQGIRLLGELTESAG